VITTTVKKYTHTHTQLRHEYFLYLRNGIMHFLSLQMSIQTFGIEHYILHLVLGTCTLHLHSSYEYRHKGRVNPPSSRHTPARARELSNSAPSTMPKNTGTSRESSNRSFTTLDVEHQWPRSSSSTPTVSSVIRSS